MVGLLNEPSNFYRRHAEFKLFIYEYMSDNVGVNHEPITYKCVLITPSYIWLFWR